MNLIAKEYVASRGEQGGVLVLSEFAGASDELVDALIINPHDIGALKHTVRYAATMSDAEQRTRMKKMHEHLQTFDVHRWAEEFLLSIDANAHANLEAEFQFERAQ